MSESDVELRVGDAERRAVDARLQAAVGEGMLTLAEYDERAARLWQSRTRGELDALTADLPAPHPVAAPSPAGPPARPRRVVAVMSEDRFAGVLQPGQEVRGYALMGKAVLDLRRQDLPSGTRVRARALMGEVEVRVPPGTHVELTGIAVMGERKLRVAPGDGPLVHVDAYALMGSVTVTAGNGRLLPAERSLPARPSYSPAVPPPPRRGALARLGRRLTAAALPLVLLAGAGAVVASGTDGRVVFGSTTVGAGDDRDVDVSVVFGSVEVVVPDGARVDRDGLIVFGSVSCDAACDGSGTGPVISVRSLGGFGSVDIVTTSERAARGGSRDERDD